jgi:hypothetical protein
MRTNPGLSVTENKVTKFFGEAYSKAACIATAVNGFKVSGIWPVNPRAIGDEEFEPSYVTERPLVVSSSDVVEESEDILHVELRVDNEDGTTSVELIEVTVQMDGNDQERSSSCSTPIADDHQQQNRVLNSYKVQPEPTADSSSQPIESRITAEMLIPLSVRCCPVAKRRAALGATVLTASPYKKTLEEKLDKKTKSNTRKRLTGKQTSKQGIAQAKSRKKAQSAEDTTLKITAVKQNRRVPTSSIIKPPKPVGRRLDLPRKSSWLEGFQEGEIPNKKKHLAALGLYLLYTYFANIFPAVSYPLCNLRMKYIYIIGLFFCCFFLQINQHIIYKLPQRFY